MDWVTKKNMKIILTVITIVDYKFPKKVSGKENEFIKKVSG